jgi:hypothetical protein
LNTAGFSGALDVLIDKAFWSHKIVLGTVSPNQNSCKANHLSLSFGCHFAILGMVVNINARLLVKA